MPGIVFGDGEGVDGVGGFIVAEGAFGGERLIAKWAAFDEVGQIGIESPFDRKRLEIYGFRWSDVELDFGDCRELKDLRITD